MPITNTSTIRLTVSSKRNGENGERRHRSTKWRPKEIMKQWWKEILCVVWLKTVSLLTDRRMTDREWSNSRKRPWPDERYTKYYARNCLKGLPQSTKPVSRASRKSNQTSPGCTSEHKQTNATGTNWSVGGRKSERNWVKCKKRRKSNPVPSGGGEKPVQIKGPGGSEVGPNMLHMSFVFFGSIIVCNGKGIPLQARTGPERSEGWNSLIPRQSAHEGRKVVSPKHRPPLPPPHPQEILLVLISVRSRVDPRAIVWPEGLCQWKIPMTLSRIEPTTFRLAAQCLNQLGHRLPHHCLQTVQINPFGGSPSHSATESVFPIYCKDF
jgi:hypothetical protein